jgi:glycosyltransferase involved in cell wall biosynthesis
VRVIVSAVPRDGLVIVLPELDADGHSHYAHYIPLIRLVSRMTRVSVVIEQPGPNARRLESQLPGVELHFQRRTAVLGRALELGVILARLRRRGFDAAYGSYSVFYGVVGGLLGRVAGMRTSYWHCRGDIAEEHRFHDLRRYVVNTLPLLLTVHLVHQVITGTPGLARLYATVFRLDPKRVRVVPNDVDVGRFGLEGEPAPREAAPVVLYVGRLSLPKGAHYLAPIFAYVSARAPSARFVVAGGGPDERQVRADIRSAVPSDRLELHGYLPNPEIGPLMRRADLLVMPSLEEGFPRRLLEAMACDLPFVASDVGGVREVAGPLAGRYLHDPGDVERAASSILAVLADREVRSELAAEGRARLEEFRVERVAPLFLATMRG